MRSPFTLNVTPPEMPFTTLLRPALYYKTGSPQIDYPK